MTSLPRVSPKLSIQCPSPPNTLPRSCPGAERVRRWGYKSKWRKNGNKVGVLLLIQQFSMVLLAVFTLEVGAMRKERMKELR